MRGRLVALVVAATIPVAGVAGSNAWTSYNAALAQSEREAVILREVAAARHGAAVDALEDMLAGIARFRELLEMSPEACSVELGRLRSLKPDRYGNFWLLDARGHGRCSGLPIDPARAHEVSRRNYTHQALETRRFTLGDFTQGALSGRSVLPAAMPIREASGEVLGVAAGSLFLDYFLRTERRPEVAATHHVWLMDSNGRILSLGDAQDGALPPVETMQDMMAARQATLRGVSRDGVGQAWSMTELDPGLRLLVGVPTAAVEAAAQNALLRRLVELAIFLGACLLAILVGVEFGCARPLRRLADRVRRWSPGRAFETSPLISGPREVRDLDRALIGAAAALQERDTKLTSALQQRDLLMAEIHHRVKNNLQVVASLLNLQSDRVRSPSARAEFATARDRVQALATLHRHLYLHQSFERISLRPFLEELARQLGDAMGAREDDRISLVIHAEEVEMASDQAISLALLLTESVSNAIRHAFPAGRHGTITITFRTEGEEAHLVVSDDGVGMGHGAAERSGDGLGLELIRGFATHLGGEAEVSADGGTRISVRFPLLRREISIAEPEAA